MKKFLIIDTFNFLHRAYHALPKTLTDQDGELTNAVYGVTSMLISAFDTMKPDYVLAAMDSREPTFRVEEFTGYKAHRKPMEDDLSRQIPKVFEVLDAFGIKQIQVNGYEADDIIGTVANEFGRDDIQIVIVSNDRDLWQLVNGNVTVMVPKSGGSAEWIGKKEAEKRLEFDPEMLIDYKALRGDPSDNIPGVYGVGDKTAKALLEQFGSLEEIYKNIDKVEPESLRKKLVSSAEEAVMSKKLATILTDVPMSLELGDCKYKEFNKGAVIETLKKYNFKSLIKRLGFDESSSPKKNKEPHENQINLL